MWSSYKPVKNNYFWVGVVVSMLAFVYGFWWLIESRDTKIQAAAAEILYLADSTEDDKTQPR